MQSTRRRGATALGLLGVAAMVAGCWFGKEAPDAALARAIAEGLLAAAPPVARDDAEARDRAAEALGSLRIFIDAMDELVHWGGHRPGKGLAPSENTTTTFNPRVYAKLYLSQFTFPGPYTVRREGDYTVLDIEADFRNGLDAGDYAYPFWHSYKKWVAYEKVRALYFVFDRGRIIAVYRVSDDAKEVPSSERQWDGQWRWTDEDGTEQPRVTLYSYLLAPGNPHLEELDLSYRRLERRLREADCMSCHAPDNQSHMSPLSLFNYPNQAWSFRHELVLELMENTMPPEDEETGAPAGLHDEDLRAELIELARTFADVGDRALAYEEEAAGPTALAAEAD